MFADENAISTWIQNVDMSASKSIITEKEKTTLFVKASFEKQTLTM